MTDVSTVPIRSADRALSRSAMLAVDIAIASGAALVLGLVRLGGPSLWFDEAYTAYAANRGPEWWLANDQYHFLYDALLWSWASVFGTSEWALRMPSVVGAMLASGLVVVLGRRFFDRWTALSAGLFLAASPFVVMWSQQARSYTLVLASSLAATLVLLRALERGSRSSWALYGIAYTAVVVGHAVAGILLAPAHLVLIAQRRKRLLPHGPLAALTVLAIAVPWAATVAMRSTGQAAGMAWLQPPSVETVLRAFADVSGAAGLGVAVAAVGLVFLWLDTRRDLGVWLGAWAVAPFGLALVMTLVTPVFLDRYLIVAAPAFALLAGVAIVRAGRRAGPGLVLATAAVCAVGIVHWHSQGTDGNWRGENWRAAVAALEERKDGTQVVVAPWWAYLAALYYGADPVPASTGSSTWVLVWSETGHALPREERSALGLASHRLADREDFGWRVSLQHWVRE